MKKVWLPLVLLMPLSACSLFTANSGDSESGGGDLESQYTQTLGDAESAYKSVDKMGGAWAYTEDLIKEAKQKASEKDLGKALELAKEALAQAKSAQVQLESQKDAKPYLF